MSADYLIKSATTIKRRCAYGWRPLCQKIVNSTLFTGFIIITICTNALMLGLSTNTDSKNENGIGLIGSFSVFFVTVYTLEFILKLCTEPKKYWMNNYNVFDFLVLILSYCHCVGEWVWQRNSSHGNLRILKILRALQTLTALRMVSFRRALQVLIKALMHAIIKWVLGILLLLSLAMFLFATMGYYFFGYEETDDDNNWSSLARAMLTLFCYITLDGWADEEVKLEEAGYIIGGRIYTVVFILIGHYILVNCLLAVIIMNVSDAAETFQIETRIKKEEIIGRKKQFMMKKQHEEVVQLLQKQKQSKFSDFADLVEEFQEHLSHDDCVMTRELCTNIIWIETLLVTLNHMDDTMHSIQQLHFEMANLLAEIVEERLEMESVVFKKAFPCTSGKR